MGKESFPRCKRFADALKRARPRLVSSTLNTWSSRSYSVNWVRGFPIGYNAVRSHETYRYPTYESGI